MDASLWLELLLETSKHFIPLQTAGKESQLQFCWMTIYDSYTNEKIKRGYILSDQQALTDELLFFSNRVL